MVLLVGGGWDGWMEGVHMTATPKARGCIHSFVFLVVLGREKYFGKDHNIRFDVNKHIVSQVQTTKVLCDPSHNQKKVK